MSSLKERKTDFVSDLVGGTTADIYIVTSISALSYLVWCIVKKKSSLFDNGNNNSLISTVIDFLLNWNNLLFSTTVYANNIPLLIVLNFIPLVPVILMSSKSSSSNDQKKSNKTNKYDSNKLVRRAVINLNTLTSKVFLPFKTYITIYRAQMMVITCVCIMAVDFNIFPRRFGKVETWGTSLMDLGVGSFVFSMGLISARSYIRQIFDSKFNYTRTIIKSFQNSLPIFILGLIRYISVKSVDYHEHVTEYGKHWNFFFTLACLPILNAVFAPIIFQISPLITGILISVFYEYYLINKGGLEFIIVGERDTFFGANREGILSLCGYFPIFLNGFTLGSCILTIIPIPGSIFKIGISKENLIKSYKKGKRGISQLKLTFILSIFFQLSYYIIDTCYVYSVSRRMANLLYVIWVSAYNCTFLFLYGLIEKVICGNIEITIITDTNDDNDDDKVEVETNIEELVSQEYVPKSLSAINLNSLTLFLVANLLTGLINLTTNTLDAGPITSMGELVLYEVVLAVLSLVLYDNGIVLR